MIHGLKSNRGLNSAAIVANQSMKATDFAADAAQKYRRCQVSGRKEGSAQPPAKKTAGQIEKETNNSPQRN
jgi:hypothetical protein